MAADTDVTCYRGTLTQSCTEIKVRDVRGGGALTCTTGAPPINLLVPPPVSGQRMSGDDVVASLTCLLGECARGVHVQINSCFRVSLHNIWTPLGRTVDDHIRLKHTFKTTLFSDRQLCSNDRTCHYKQPESCQLTHR